MSVLRPPVTGDRLAVAVDGRVVLRLRHPWADGTTHVAFEPTAFFERLAVLVPRPPVAELDHVVVFAAHFRRRLPPRVNRHRAVARRLGGHQGRLDLVRGFQIRAHLDALDVPEFFRPVITGEWRRFEGTGFFRPLRE